ncbi:MAG: TadE/TadG family type IV pilus assembly protein [Turicibacter sp.]
MKRRIEGSISIEAAIGIPILIIVIMFWIEFCFMLYSISVTEHAFALAVIKAKKTGDGDGDYSNYVKEHIRENGGYLWANSTLSNSVNIKVSYYKGFDNFTQCAQNKFSLEDCSASSETSNNMSIAVYSLTYVYNPIVSILFPKIPIKREVLTIQEYERCMFNISSGGNCE